MKLKKHYKYICRKHGYKSKYEPCSVCLRIRQTLTIIGSDSSIVSAIRRLMVMRNLNSAQTRISVLSSALALEKRLRV